MTTIVYSDGVLAAESQYTFDNQKFFNCMKVFSGKNSAIGYAGNPQYVDNMVRWWRSLESDHLLHPSEWRYRNPEQIDGDETVMVLLVHKYYGVFKLFGDGHVFEIPEGFAAIGSGGPIAHGALLAGASAVDAVKAAIELDLYSGGNINAIQIDVEKRS